MYWYIIHINNEDNEYVAEYTDDEYFVSTCFESAKHFETKLYAELIATKFKLSCKIEKVTVETVNKFCNGEKICR